MKKDNPNPRANIAILCTYEFFFHAFYTTYEHLTKIGNNVEFVLDFTAKPKGSKYPEESKESLRRILREVNVFFRDIEVTTLLPGEFFDKYAVLVALNNVGYMEHPCNSNKKKVRIFYGPAKEGWAYGLGNAFFDLILCPGYYSQEKLTKFYSAKVVPVGEPKLDALYQNGFLSEEAKEIDLALDKNKKTILYMPTWGALSSSKIVVPSLLKLLPNYNIIVKIHHITNMFSPEEMKYLDNNRFIIIKELVPVTDALKLADVVISDSSSSIFGAMVAGKGLVLIDTIKGDEKFFTEASFLAHKRIKI